VHPDRRHFPTDDLRSGAYESWELEAIDPVSRVVGLAVGLVLTRVGAWWWTLVCGTGRPLVLVADDEVPLPGWPNLEVRSSGLWAEVGINDPGEHLSVDLEAFGVEIDDVDDVFGSGRGVRCPVGLDVEWHRSGDAEHLEDGHLLPARVEGEILVGSEKIELSSATSGSWVHRFGTGPWPGPRHRVESAPVVIVAVGGLVVGGWAWRHDLVRSPNGMLSWLSAPQPKRDEPPAG
jgi:hypothetical protein